MQIAKFTEEITITSLELVEFVNGQRGTGEAELRHRDFCAKVPKVLGDGVCEKFRAPHTNPQNGQVYYIYKLPKREACLMAMSYSYDLQAKVFDRMTELEAKAAPVPFKIPQTMAEALRLAADQSEQIEQQKVLIAEAAPKVEFVGRYVQAEGAKGFREVAKLLQANEAEFRAFLSNEKIMYRLGGDWVAYQNHADARRFVVKTGVSDGGHAFNSCKFTPKGVAWVAGEWGKYKVRAASHA